MKSLVDIMVENNWRNDTHYEFGTDKEFNHKYCTAFYDKEFLKYKDKNIRLLEIGVHRGGGLAVFHEYFKDGDIYGVDPHIYGAKENCQKFPRIRIFHENGYNQEFADTMPQFDIIIDDGPHTKESHLDSLKIYLSKLKPGGVFIIEDIAQMEWTEEYKTLVPQGMNYEIIDAREISNMNDSIMFVVRYD
jgi:predicted O-methyltransferase YrrM